jgi:hypothetical protein
MQGQPQQAHCSVEGVPLRESGIQHLQVHLPEYRQPASILLDSDPTRGAWSA